MKQVKHPRRLTAPFVPKQGATVMWGGRRARIESISPTAILVRLEKTGEITSARLQDLGAPPPLESDTRPSAINGPGADHSARQQCVQVSDVYRQEEMAEGSPPYSDNTLSDAELDGVFVHAHTAKELPNGRTAVDVSKQPRSRIKAPIAAFRVVPGAYAVLEGRAVRVIDICSPMRIQVRVEGTRELNWTRAEELSPPVPSEPSRSAIHPHDVDPAAEALARAWSDVLAELPVRPSVSQYEAAAAKMGVHCRTVTRRHAFFLVDPTPASQLKAPPGPAPGSRRLHAATEAIIDRSIQEVYLKQPRCPITVVHVRARQLCAESGLKKPSYKAVRRRVRAINPMLAATKRLGPDRALAVQAPSVRGITTHRALEMVQIDHALVDLIVVSPDTRLPIGRPWITVAIDVHTRCVVGYYLSMRTPTQTCVALCLAHACLPKGDWMRRLGLEMDYPMFGRFEVISWDNAKTFRAAGIAAQCERYGIRVNLRPVKKPHYGAYVERYIGTFMGKIHLLPGTTFSNPQQRKDYQAERHAIMTLKELAAWIAREIVGKYHHTEHRGLGGMTPYAKWQASWTKADGKIELPSMIANPRDFLVGLLPREQRAVTREGIALRGLKYWDPAIAPLINDGLRHYIHYNHGDLTKVYLHYQGDYVDVPLLDRSRAPFTLYELCEAKQVLARSGMGHANEEVLFAAMAQQRQIQDEAAIKSKRARQKQARRAEAPVSVPSTTSVDYTLQLAPKRRRPVLSMRAGAPAANARVLMLWSNSWSDFRICPR